MTIPHEVATSADHYAAPLSSASGGGQRLPEMSRQYRRGSITMPVVRSHCGLNSYPVGFRYRAFIPAASKEVRPANSEKVEPARKPADWQQGVRRGVDAPHLSWSLKSAATQPVRSNSDSRVLPPYWGHGRRSTRTPASRVRTAFKSCAQVESCRAVRDKIRRLTSAPATNVDAETTTSVLPHGPAT